MICAKALRFNNGDLFHEVPYLLLGDGTKRYTKFERPSGQKASHGCIRVARLPNAQGLCQNWLWDNMKKGTKVLIWDDDGRAYPYPDPNTQLFYNAKGGQYYHAVADCSGVRAAYLPLTGFLYSQLGEKPFHKLEPCPFCVPVRPKSWIDQFNEPASPRSRPGGGLRPGGGRRRPGPSRGNHHHSAVTKIRQGLKTAPRQQWAVFIGLWDIHQHQHPRALFIGAAMKPSLV